MNFSLSKRTGKIGPSINTRTEKHGDDDVPGIDIPVSGILLDAGELAVLLQDGAAHESFFTNARSKHPEPRFLDVLPVLNLQGKFEDAKVTLAAGRNQAVILKPAKVSKIRLEPQVGGLTAMSCTVQGNPDDHTDVLDMLNKSCTIAILNAKLEDRDDEPELPLGPGGVTMGEEAGAAEKPRRAPKKRERKDIDG